MLDSVDSAGAGLPGTMDGERNVRSVVTVAGLDEADGAGDASPLRGVLLFCSEI